MTLMFGRGPLSDDPAGWFSPPIPADVVFVEPHHRRVQALLDGHAVIDTENALLVHRKGEPLRFAFPAGEVGALPAEPVAAAPGYVTVPWEAVDTWLEEGRALVHYPPNPYHRVDCRPTRRGLRVAVDGAVLVDTTDTTIVFETSLPPRLYVAPALVRTALLRRTETTSYCNYKGSATYLAVTIGSTVIEDAAWSYQNPLPESSPIAGLLTFDETRVDVLAELPEAPAGAADCDCRS
ncbi:DUF427 domain-containing protein [Mycolicibacterium komossense]|uniref:DUF427 domain-containing protein n=1 Tax=Mycolicibacterium komossense TaxID=1779 RepID=A0ABT3CI47_9MYCO|nr:DUF427 domain-containing protein [Mycolicibacterium komossense]MCV7229214.1 DUF427 domain-containing protein [Mycolicibacterium komossense]